MTKGLFISATGTDVGKTYLTALLVKKLRQAGYNAGYYKGALSGAERQPDGSLLPGDAAYVCEQAGIPESPDKVVSYIYQTAVSPHLAAQLEGTPPELDIIARDFQQLAQRCEYLTVEGSGGVVCPLRWEDEQQLMLTDVIQRLRLPVLLVADAHLGSINAAVLTVAYLRQKQIPIVGIILNRFQAGNVMEEDNKKMIERLTGVPVLTTVAEGQTEINLRAEQIAAFYQEVDSAI